MKCKKFLPPILAVLFSAVILALAFGYAPYQTPGITFRAIIPEDGFSWGEGNLLVKGIPEENDLNHRGRYILWDAANAKLVRNGNRFDFDELEVGQTVAVTYTGPIAESSPAHISKVLKIELLDST